MHLSNLRYSYYPNYLIFWSSKNQHVEESLCIQVLTLLEIMYMPFSLPFLFFWRLSFLYLFLSYEKDIIIILFIMNHWQKLSWFIWPPSNILSNGEIFSLRSQLSMAEKNVQCHWSSSIGESYFFCHSCLPLTSIQADFFAAKIILEREPNTPARFWHSGLAFVKMSHYR